MSITEDLAVHRTWWKESNVYQIYPASFKDSNGDGIGDIPGIVSELDYIAGLGVDIVWLCPCYKSPQVDMGYDISDYKDIHEQYGTLSDIDDLISGLHKRSLKLVMDLVVNHTSDKHQWFQSAISSKNSPYRDWYIWKNPKYAADGSRLPPNNWSAAFGGSAWEYDEKSDEYYLHLYAKEQPDLNWENPKVREAVHDIVRFWLDRGVDGFRLDVINQISKDPAMPDAPITNPAAKYQTGNMFYSSGPRLHEYLQGLGKILKEYNAFSVGEMPGVYDPTEIIKAVGFERNELNMIIQFEIVNLDIGSTGRFTPRTWALTELKEIVNKWETFMQVNDGWNAIYLENHDQARSVSRFASDAPNVRRVAAQMLATFLGFQSGTIFVYQGQELGLANVPKTWGVAKYRDIESLNNYAENVAAGASQEVLASILSEMQKKARDNARTPMQWDETTYAGFSSVVPWMDVNEDYQEWNAKAQVNDASSVYAYWQSVFRLRKEFKDILVYGTFSLVDALNENVFAYKRTYGSSDALIVTLFKDTETKWAVPEEYLKPGKILLSNYDRIDIAGEIVLRPFEAFVLLL
ncbi:glycoside hydrolase superfamily [Lipomyces tetrasporus]|uniref:Glycoside hydrolase superfamily n=1 Tax=Lipomyces tetrasporus TaxID=54092 RepID=A0AAD7VRJ4_9ASCO|nr:glycoside hydrolase superfamily [Lipomyces tetrasporus]KAJ8098981.1 glycoside hydrolase superfamily [Lipomyces tetrasporus]